MVDTKTIFPVRYYYAVSQSGYNYYYYKYFYKCDLSALTFDYLKIHINKQIEKSQDTTYGSGYNGAYGFGYGYGYINEYQAVFLNKIRPYFVLPGIEIMKSSSITGTSTSNNQSFGDFIFEYTANLGLGGSYNVPGFILTHIETLASLSNNT